MAIDPAEKAMLRPTIDGGSVGNFGIAFTPKDYPDNADVCKESVGTWNQVNMLVGKVSYKGANQSQLPAFGVGGSSLGRPGVGTGE